MEIVFKSLDSDLRLYEADISSRSHSSEAVGHDGVYERDMSQLITGLEKAVYEFHTEAREKCSVSGTSQLDVRRLRIVDLVISQLDARGDRLRKDGG